MESKSRLHNRLTHESIIEDPTIQSVKLTDREKNIYKDGCNPRFWSISDNLDAKEYNRTQKSHSRAKANFRKLLNQYRQGDNLQYITATLIRETWERLSAVDDGLLARINERLIVWQSSSIKPDNRELIKETVSVHREIDRDYNSDDRNEIMLELPKKCPKLTGLEKLNVDCGKGGKCPILTNLDDTTERSKMSDINRLSIELIPDGASSQQLEQNESRVTRPKPDAFAPTPSSTRKRSDGSLEPAIEPLRPGRPTATQQWDNAALLAEAEKRRRSTKASKEDAFGRAADNLRNNLVRRLERILNPPKGGPIPLFPPAEVIRLTPEQHALLDSWRGNTTRSDNKVVISYLVLIKK